MTTLEIILICVLGYVLLVFLFMPLLLQHNKSFGSSLVDWLATIFALPLIIGLVFWYFVIESIIKRVSNLPQDEQPK